MGRQQKTQEFKVNRRREETEDIEKEKSGNMLEHESMLITCNLQHTDTTVYLASLRFLTQHTHITHISTNT